MLMCLAVLFHVHPGMCVHMRSPRCPVARRGGGRPLSECRLGLVASAQHGDDAVRRIEQLQLVAWAQKRVHGPQRGVVLPEVHAEFA